MPAPSLRIPVSADVSRFQQDMQKTSSIATKATLAITKQVIQMNAGFLASQGAAGAATLAFGRVLGVLGPIALGVMAVRDAFRLMGYATGLAEAKIAEFNDVAEKANASGFSTEFFQRITKSGGLARDKIDDLTEALKKFNEESAPRLGGSSLQNRINELSKAGNFKGNAGVGMLSGANDFEARLRAIVALIDQAMQKGERLAAIDLADRVFGPKVAAALRADSGYLDDMLKRADALNKTQIVSDEDLGRALELKRRMDDAQKVLADKWKPIQNDIAQLGINYHESWVSITEDLAAAVGYATQLYQALKQVPDWFANRIGNASIWKSISDTTGALGLNSTPELMGIVMKDDPTFGQTEANKKLAAALRNYQNVKKAMQEASDVSSSVRGDTSKPPGAKAAEAEANAFDSAASSIERHIARTEADTKAVGLGANALAEFRAEAQLMVAAEQAGIPVTQTLRDRIQDLAQDAGEAAEALARARVANDISFGRQTAFLSSEDVAIARQLAGIYGNDVPAALASSEAAALRMNNAMTDMGRTLQDANRGAWVEFGQQIRNGASAMDALKTAGLNALSKIADKLMGMAADGLWNAAFGGSGGLGGLLGNLFKAGSGVGMPLNILPTGHASGGMISGPGGPRSDSILARVSPGEFVTNAAATKKHRALLEAINSGQLPKFAAGGMVPYPGGESGSVECMGLPA